MEQRFEAIDKRFEAISKQVANDFGWTTAAICIPELYHALPRLGIDSRLDKYHASRYVVCI